MTQNDKDLLLRDLCARLPYGVKIDNVGEPSMLTSINNRCRIIVETGEVDKEPRFDVLEIEDCKPYLFPLSSMTEEQDKEYALLQTSPGKEGFLYVWNCATMMKWLIENRFDYNGLIPKGLANDATGKNIY